MLYFVDRVPYQKLAILYGICNVCLIIRYVNDVRKASLEVSTSKKISGQLNGNK